MSLSGVNDALAGFYQYVERTRKTAAGGVSFMAELQKADEADNLTREEVYKKYLEQRFGNVMIRNVGKTKKALTHEIHSYGVYVESDGTVYTYVCGGLKPEVRAKIEAKIKAEDEAKAKRKKQYRKHHEEVLENHKRQMELVYRDYMAVSGYAAQSGSGRFTYAEKQETISSIITAYKMDAISTPDIFG